MFHILDKYLSNHVTTIKKLSFQKKAAFGLSLIYRQKGTIEIFDKDNKNKIYPSFLELINTGKKIILEGTSTSDTKKVKIIHLSYIEDNFSDPFDQTGQLAQTIFIGLLHFFDFCSTKNDDDMLKSINQYINNVHLVAYTDNEDYDYSVVFGKESLLFAEIIDLINKHKVETSSGLNLSRPR